WDQKCAKTSDMAGIKPSPASSRNINPPSSELSTVLHIHFSLFPSSHTRILKGPNCSNHIPIISYGNLNPSHPNPRRLWALGGLPFRTPDLVLPRTFRTPGLLFSTSNLQPPPPHPLSNNSDCKYGQLNVMALGPHVL